MTATDSSRKVEVVYPPISHCRSSSHLTVSSGLQLIPGSSASSNRRVASGEKRELRSDTSLSKGNLDADNTIHSKPWTRRFRLFYCGVFDHSGPACVS